MSGRTSRGVSQSFRLVLRQITDDGFDLQKLDLQVAQYLRGGTTLRAQQAEQKVFGVYLLVFLALRLFLRQAEYAPRRLCEASHFIWH